MNKILIVLVGIPGSGKSTFVRKRPAFNIVSRDEIRFSLLQDEDDYFKKEKEVFNIFIDKLNKSIQENEYTVADATHLNKASRNKLLSRIKGQDRTYALYFNIPLELAIERNNQRVGRSKVPEDKIREMYKNMTRPELNEGFDTIYDIDEFEE